MTVPEDKWLRCSENMPVSPSNEDCPTTRWSRLAKAKRLCSRHSVGVSGVSTAPQPEPISPSVFRNHTVIIIGAGASCECGLPTGAELRTKIARLLDIRFKHGYEQVSGDYDIVEALRIAVQRDQSGSRDINPYLHAGRHIGDAMPQAISIDNFIDTHQGDAKLELCGKLAIVKAILQGERSSSLYFDPMGTQRRINFDALDTTWYNTFVQLLTQNCTIKSLAERLSKVSFVIFNYDRCIEHFLYHSIQNVYGVDANAAAELVRSMTILHPYGVVGNLPWQGGNQTIDFGGQPRGRQLLELAGGIKTFTEGTDPSASDILKIREYLNQATTLLFLGFAFHAQNLELLNPGRNHPDPIAVRYYGTAFGMSASDCDLVREDLVKLGSARPDRIILRNDKKCLDMFREYWRSLALG